MFVSHFFPQRGRLNVLSLLLPKAPFPGASRLIRIPPRPPPRSYLHPDDVRHPADLRLPVLAAEVPEERRGGSVRADQSAFHLVNLAALASAR